MFHRVRSIYDAAMVENPVAGFCSLFVFTGKMLRDMLFHEFIVADMWAVYNC